MKRNTKNRRLRRRRLLLERLDARRVFAAITGVVFEDANASLRREAAESGLANRLVYVDSNEDATFDSDEAFTLTDAAGRFSFPQLPGGDYVVRVHGISQPQNPQFSQQLTVPFSAEATGQSFSIIGLKESVSGNQRTYSIDGDEIFSANWASGLSSTSSESTELGLLQVLPGDHVLAMGAGNSSDALWVVDVDADEWRPLAVQQDSSGSSQPIPTELPEWKDVAVDGNGRGLALGTLGDNFGTQTVVYAIDATNPEAATLTSTEEEVVAEASIVSSATGPRTVLASPTPGGLLLELWSNTTASRISLSGSEVSGASSLLDFDDQSGLLLLRQIGGGVTVVDVNNQFATLFEFDSLDGPVHLDSARDVLWAVSPAGNALTVLDLTNGDSIAELAIDTASLGSITDILPASSDPETGLSSLAVVGAAGIREFGIDRPSSRRVALVDQQSVDVSFGIRLIGTNDAPIYQSLPQLITNEDEAFFKPAPSVLDGAVDVNGDQILVVQTGTAQSAFAVISPTGSINYQPSENFNGTDLIPVVLHDGRDITTVNLPIQVNAVPDDPTGIAVNLSPVAENAAPGTVVGTLSVIDVDNDQNHDVEVNDSRFQVVAGDVVFVGGELDFETEFSIPLTFTATDRATSATVNASATLALLDADDPITRITPEVAYAFENAFGDVIAELTVEDQDAEQFHEFTVDDIRFIVDEGQLRLVETVALDYESEAEILVNVTAETVETGDKFTQEIKIIVRDLIEQPASMTLVGDSVTEFERGAVVGDLFIDGVANPNGYTFTVDDLRFEVVGGVLKLVDDAFVNQDDDTAIVLQVTAVNDNPGVNEISETFTITVIESDTPFHNHDLPQDVNHDGVVTAQDALLIINYLNVHGPGPIGQGDPSVCYDVNGDGFITALDALLVLNFLNRRGSPPQAEGESEGDNATTPIQELDTGLPDVGDPTQTPSPITRESIAPIQADLELQQFGPSIAGSKGANGLDVGPSEDEHSKDRKQSVLDWVLEQRGTDEETEAEIDEFLSLLEDDDAL